jgi:hypothetical protein
LVVFNLLKHLASLASILGIANMDDFSAHHGLDATVPTIRNTVALFLREVAQLKSRKTCWELEKPDLIFAV